MKRTNKNLWKRIISCLFILILVGGCSAYGNNSANKAAALNQQSLSQNGSSVKMHFLSTGNSDCIIIQAEKTVLIDAGQNNDEDLVVNYLKKLGVKKIDYIISTHPDADHCGGLDAVVKNFEIKECFVGNGSSTSITYRSFINALAEKGLTPAVPLANKQFMLGKNCYMQFYNTKARSTNSNELSLVTLLVDGNKKALFTGDADYKVENQLHTLLSDVDVLKVSHHGSKTATSQAFLQVVKPEYAIICTGKNGYGHPDKTVIKRLEKAGSKVYRTDYDGNIIVEFNNNQVSVSTHS